MEGPKKLWTKHHSQPDIPFIPDPRPRHLRALTLIPDPHIPSVQLEVPLESPGDIPTSTIRSLLLAIHQRPELLCCEPQPRADQGVKRAAAESLVYVCWGRGWGGE
jgi:hypothetical protein